MVGFFYGTLQMTVLNDGVPVTPSAPVSSRYAEPVDLSSRYDIRTIGQICTDDEQELSREDILANSNVLTALNSASGRVEAALRHGNRYSIEDLQSLTGNSTEHLKDIVCAIAMVRLLRRRPGSYTDLLAQVSADAEDYLKMLSAGYDVFSIDAQVEAGMISDDGNTNSENAFLLNIRNNVSDNMIGRYFPHRGDTARRRRDFG
jgi:phage gp36-like protein